MKFIGNYHGHADAFLAAAGSAAGTVPGTPGVPEEVISHTLLAQYNDLAAVEKPTLRSRGDEIACVIVEPVRRATWGWSCPKTASFRGCATCAPGIGALLIFDEVITGFRLCSIGGAQERYGITPDLTTLGKIIGGGFPVGCYGGKREIMEHMAPVGGVFQAGHPVRQPGGHGRRTGHPQAACRRATMTALEERTRKPDRRADRDHARRQGQGRVYVATRIGLGLHPVLFGRRPGDQHDRVGPVRPATPTVCTGGR